MSSKNKRLSVSILYLLIIVSLLLISYNSVFAYPTENYCDVSLRAQRIYFVPGQGWTRCDECPTGKIGCCWCWAATYQSAIIFHTDYHPITDVVCEAKGSVICEGASPSQLPGLLDYAFGINSYYYSGKPSSSTVQQCIYNQHPIYISDGSHATLLYGYYFNDDDFYIAYMDPWTPSWSEILYANKAVARYIKIFD